MQDKAVKILKMEDHNILVALAGIVSALGLKEVWSIIKQKIDIGAKKEKREENVYAQQIEVLTNKIQQLETKIELLIEENIQLRIKVAKMSERLVTNAKKRVQSKRNNNERN
jgi:predicted RNase H-like nuclease (RuvC/YqgF family)